MNIFNKFLFLNIYEVSNKFNMNAIDYLFGKGSGGIFTTNILAHKRKKRKSFLKFLKISKNTNSLWKNMLICWKDLLVIMKA